MFLKVIKLTNTIGMLKLGIIILYLIIIAITRSTENYSEGNIMIRRGLLEPEWLCLNPSSNNGYLCDCG